MNNLFDKRGLEDSIIRINALSPTTNNLWGKMNVSQMLAHLNIAYEFTYEDIHTKPGLIKKWLLKTFVKNGVVGPKPYPKNGRTAPEFIISGDKDFEAEKDRLISYMRKTYELGADHFDQKDNHSFGPLSKEEWNTLFAKHLDHHLTQFGV